MADQLVGGQWFRLLTLVDNHTHEAWPSRSASD